MKWIAFVLCSLLLAASVSAVQPAQQSNKIFLNPFYRASMSLNTNYTYNVSFVPADGVSKVLSAVVSFDAWIAPTVTFTAWVNGQACNNPTYVISTTYATAGRGVATFDCSNVITKAGIYNMTLRPTQANVGASTAWLDITYMNSPIGSVSVSGTEYVSGDPATVFVQLLDSYENPVENGNCYVDIYYPLLNGTHPYTVRDAPMVHAGNGDDGLYYYDLIAPSQLGVYMVSAKCSYTYNWQWIFPTTELTFWPVRQAQTGTWGGAEQSLNNPEDATYDSCQTTGACVANYTFNVSSYGNLTNVTSINLYYLGEATKATTMTFYYWNGTAMKALPNTIALVATGSTTAPSGIDQLQTNFIPESAIINGVVKVQINENQGTTHALYNNWLSLAILSSYGTISQNVKGNSEMHISGSSDTSDTRFYTVTTCDGFFDGRCAIFTNDVEFNLVEGEIEDYLNVTAKTTANGVQIEYDSPYGVDCTALYWVKQWNGTGWVLFTNYSVSSEVSTENCKVQINKNMVGGQDYRYWFKFDNYMKWEVDWSKRMSDTVNKTIAFVCDGLNQTYMMPITELTVLPNDTTKEYCYQAKDDQYWIDVYWADSQGVNVAGEYVSYMHELRFYRQMLQIRYEWLVHEGQVLPKLNTINLTVSSINQTTSQTKTLVDQIWTWVQSLFGWSQQNENQVVMKSVS